MCHAIPRAMVLGHHHVASGSYHHLLPALSVFFPAWLQFIPYIAAKGRFKNVYLIISFAHLDFSYGFHLYLKYKFPTRASNPCLPPTSCTKECSSHTDLFSSWNIPSLIFPYGFYAYCLCLESSASAGFFRIFRAQHKCYRIQEDLSDHLILSGLIPPSNLSFSSWN